MLSANLGWVRARSLAADRWRPSAHWRKVCARRAALSTILTLMLSRAVAIALALSVQTLPAPFDTPWFRKSTRVVPAPFATRLPVLIRD